MCKQFMPGCSLSSYKPGNEITTRLMRKLPKCTPMTKFLSSLFCVQPSVRLNTWRAKGCAELVFSMHVYAPIVYLLQPYSQCLCCVSMHFVSILFRLQRYLILTSDWSGTWLLLPIDAMYRGFYCVHRLFMYAMTIAALRSVSKPGSLI